MARGKTTAKTEVAAGPARKREMTSSEAALFLESAKRRKARPARIGVVLDDAHGLSAPFDSEIAFRVVVSEALGTSSDAFAEAQLTILANAAGEARGKPQMARLTAAALAIVQAVEPKNELEAALAVQMAATHQLAGRMIEYAAAATTMEHLASYTGLATKLSRTFVAQMEALAKLRNAGKQVVEVTHVHKQVNVAPGAQAIVGDVHHRGGGGDGGQSAEAGQPQTRSLESPGDSAIDLAMWGADPVGVVMSVPSGGREETLQDARRDQPRRAEGAGER